MRGANLRAVSAVGASFAGADSACADLSIGNHARASLRGATLTGAWLDGSVFLAADLSGADLRRTSLAGCDWEGAWFIGTRWDHPPRRGSSGEHAARDGFPTFVVALREHLTLLKRITAETLWILATTVAFSPDPRAEVLALLGAGDWRPMLVGAGAMVAGAASPATLAEAWRRFDRSPWISPQLAGVLLLTDPDFEARARAALMAALVLPARPAAARSAYRSAPAAPMADLPRWTPTKRLASLAAAYRRVPGGERELLDALDALEREGQLDAEGALEITAGWVSRVIRLAPAEMRAGWARVPG